MPFQYNSNLENDDTLMRKKPSLYYLIDNLVHWHSNVSHDD
jgi:hypothetical protein